MLKRISSKTPHPAKRSTRNVIVPISTSPSRFELGPKYNSCGLFDKSETDTFRECMFSGKIGRVLLGHAEHN
jgi:hypothetical protein